MFVDNEECLVNRETIPIEEVFVLEEADVIEWPGVSSAKRRGMPGILQFFGKSKRIIQILQGRQCR